MPKTLTSGRESTNFAKRINKGGIICWSESSVNEILALTPYRQADSHFLESVY